VVRAIYVDDGQFVKAGAVLIDLDSTDPTADVARLQYDLKSVRLSVARNQTFLNAIDRMKGSVKLPVLEGISDTDIQNEQRLLDGQYAEFRGRLGELDAEIVRRRAEENSTRERIIKLEQTSRIAAQRSEDFKSLLDSNFVSKHAYQDREQYRIEQQQDLAVEKSRLLEIRAALTESRRKRDVLVAERRRIALDEIDTSEHQVSTTSQELLKAEQRNRLTQLTAPVDGTVQQLAVHTIGGVVTGAQPLMVIVPKDNPLQVEAYLENKDIGFVKAGLDAEVKVEAFPYTKYGILRGKVLHVSNDAINDEKRGLVYLARIQLEKATMRLEEREVSLTPGMAVTAEIKTGNRRLIEYFLSPLMQYSQESFHER
jgi:hemolysin D